MTGRTPEQLAEAVRRDDDSTEEIGALAELVERMAVATEALREIESMEPTNRWYQKVAREALAAVEGSG